jgi:ribose transport system substrate-binding protein
MKKLFLIFGVIIFVANAYWGCNRDQKSEVEGPTVALVLKTLNNPFFVDMETGAREAAKTLGVNLIVQGAERDLDVDKQMQIMENLIQRSVDALCIVPAGSQEIIPAILKANKARIPVLNIDSRVDMKALKEAGGEIEIFIGSDNYDGGRVIGNYLVKILNGKGKIGILEGVPGQEAGVQRLEGFLSVINNAPGVKILSSQTANWEMSQGYDVFQNMMQAHQDIEALFSENDNMALGAIEAISAAGRTGDILVLGFDAIDDAKKAIKNGTMEATIAQSPALMGKLALEYAVKAIAGNNIPEEIPVEIQLVTKETLLNNY